MIIRILLLKQLQRVLQVEEDVEESHVVSQKENPKKEENQEKRNHVKDVEENLVVKVLFF